MEFVKQPSLADHLRREVAQQGPTTAENIAALYAAVGKSRVVAPLRLSAADR